MPEAALACGDMDFEESSVKGMATACQALKSVGDCSLDRSRGNFFKALLKQMVTRDVLKTNSSKRTVDPLAHVVCLAVPLWPPALVAHGETSATSTGMPATHRDGRFRHL